ncbi:type 4a pilus biogenesis protein PilO [Botrimarina hoheduenensis]|nr:type 4a pilus biogenesis protein PilO [Botrimarina hoheduenensis]
MSVGLGVLALIYLTASQPLITWRASLANQTRNLRLSLQEAPGVRSRHSVLKSQLDGLLTRVEDVTKRMPNEPRDDEFLADLSRIAREKGVQLEDFRRGTVSQDKTHSSLNVMVTARANHAGLCGLIDAVQRLPRLAELNEMQITGAAQGETYPVLLQYTLYYAAVTNDTAATPAPVPARRG